SALRGPANTCETVGDDRTSLTATRPPISLDSVPLCLPVWQVVSPCCAPTGAQSRCHDAAWRTYVETGVGNDRSRIDATASGAFDPAAFGAGPRWRRSNAGYGYARRHLQRPGHFHDGNSAAGPRHR